MNTTTQPKFSFLMCVNRLNPHLAQAIESVLAQTSTDFEFFIIANNCDDDLWSFLSKYNDERIRLHRTVVGQLGFNLNYGLNLIRHGYVLRMDADDISLPRRLEITRQRLMEHDYPDALGGGVSYIDDQGKVVGRNASFLTNEQVKAVIWRRSPLTHPACALNVKSLLLLRGYSGGFMSEDYDLWLRASRENWFRFQTIEDILLEYRIHEGQARGNKLGYAEVAGYMVREVLLGSGARYICGSVLAIIKRYLRAK